MKIRKLFVAMIVVAVLLAPVTGLTAELKIGLKAEPSSMDPHYHNLTPNNMMAKYTFDNLIKQDSKQNLKPALAISWNPISDLTWELKLRRGVKFHDGSPFTAEDVKFTLERAPEVPNSPSSFSRYINHIVKIEIVDDHTIRLTTADPFPLMATYLSAFTIISKKYGEGAATKDFNSGKAMIGTGPFKFVEWIPGDRAVYTRNDEYWGGKSEWEKVILKPLSNSSARVAALLAGDVDIIDFVPTADIENLKKNADLTMGRSVSARVIYLHLDSDRDASPFLTDAKGNPLTTNPLKDVRIRRAISMAINRPAIVSKVMEGNAIAAGQLLPPGFFGVSPKLKPLTYDPEGARKLMAEAGWGDGFGLTIHGPNNRYVNDAKICQAVAQMLTRVGIQTKVDTMPKNIFFPRGTKLEFSFMLVGWGSATGEPSSPLGALLHTYDKAAGYGASNRGRFSNKEMDSALEEALRSVDQEKHKNLLIKATEIAMREVGIIPLHYQVNIWAMQKGLNYTARTDAHTLAFDVHKAK